MFSQKLVPHKRSQEQRLRKKMTNGIVGLTRPRFGKRSFNGEAEISTEIFNPLAKSISAYLARMNYPIKRSKTSAKDFSSLTRPRFGKRSLHGPSHVLKFIQNEQGLSPNMVLVSDSQFLDQDGKIKRSPENEAASDNKPDEEDVLR